MSERRRRGNAGRNVNGLKHEDHFSDINERKASYIEALSCGISSFEFVTGGGLLNYQFTLQGIGLLLSGADFLAYGLFIHFRHRIRGVRKFSHMWLMIAITLNVIGLSPLLLLLSYAGANSNYHVTMNTVVRTGKILKSTDAVALFGIPTDIPTFTIPMQAAISFTVDNIGQSKQQIKAISVSSSKSRNGPWTTLCPVSLEGVVLVLSMNRRESVLVDPSNFVNGNLLGKSLAPGDAITSWVAVECTSICPGSYFRIVIRDAAGHHGVVTSADAFGEGEVMLAPKSGMRTLGPGPDLTPLPNRLDPACKLADR